MKLYHGTAASQLQSILDHGLLPGGGRGGDAWAEDHDPLLDGRLSHRPPSVYLTPKLGVALWFADMAAQENRSQPVVLAVELPREAELKTDEEFSEAGRRFEGAIPPACLHPLEARELARTRHRPLPFF